MGVFDKINTHALGNNTWPPPPRAPVWEEVEFLAALRTSDEAALRARASVPWNYPYTVTPLPRMLSRASANMLYGEPANVEPADEDENDAERLAFIVNENGLDAECVRGALMASSEGEVFGRVRVDPSLLDVPIIEFVSTRNVVPEFAGRFLVAATFVSVWQTGAVERYRRLERYVAGAIETTLWRGTNTRLGLQVDLESFPATQGTPPVIYTGIARPLCCFIPNSIDADPTRGFSDYRGLEQRFMDLNEAAKIGSANARMTGRKRAVVDAAYLNSAGKLNDNDDLLIAKSSDTMMGAGAKPLQVLEYTFEAQQLIAWVDHIIDSSITFAGMSPQSVGRSVDGGAVSGTALRLKNAFSLIESSGKGRHFDRGMGWLLRCAAVIDSRRTTEGGFGRKWTNPDTTPIIERSDPMPRDDMEAAQIIAALAGAEAISTEEKVKALHPGWTQDQVNAEVERIGASAPTINDNGQAGSAGGPSQAVPNVDANGIPTLRPTIMLPAS